MLVGPTAPTGPGSRRGAVWAPPPPRAGVGRPPLGREGQQGTAGGGSGSGAPALWERAWGPQETFRSVSVAGLTPAAVPVQLAMNVLGRAKEPHRAEGGGQGPGPHRRVLLGLAKELSDGSDPGEGRVGRGCCQQGSAGQPRVLLPGVCGHTWGLGAGAAHRVLGLRGAVVRLAGPELGLWCCGSQRAGVTVGFVEGGVWGCRAWRGQVGAWPVRAEAWRSAVAQCASRAGADWELGAFWGEEAGKSGQGMHLIACISWRTRRRRMRSRSPSSPHPRPSFISGFSSPGQGDPREQAAERTRRPRELCPRRQGVTHLSQMGPEPQDGGSPACSEPLEGAAAGWSCPPRAWPTALSSPAP